MIVESVINLLVSMIEAVFSWIELPPLPAEVQSVIDELIGYLEGSIGLLSMFIDFDMLKILLPVVVIVVNFEHVWDLVMFVLRKIPFIGIK